MKQFEDKQLFIRQLLCKKLAEGKQRNESFSMRALAKRAGMYSSALSEIMNGKRNISQKMAYRIMDRLNLSHQDRLMVQKVFSGTKSKTTEGLKRLVLDYNDYQLMSEWYYFAILSLFELKEFKNDPIWVAKKLGLSVKVVHSALERMADLKLLKKVRGKYYLTENKYSSPDGISNIYVKRVHQQNLRKAEDALYDCDVSKRDFTGITLAINPSKMTEAKKKIREFLGEMEELLETGDKNEVYKMCVQLFPLTKKGE